MVIIQLDSEQLSSVIQAAVSKALADQQTETRPEGDQFFNTREAANFLNITPRTLTKKAREGEIKSSKRARKLYFLKKDLTEWLKAGSRKTNAEISAEANTYIQSKKKKAPNDRV